MELRTPGEAWLALVSGGRPCDGRRMSIEGCEGEGITLPPGHTHKRVPCTERHDVGGGRGSMPRRGAAAMGQPLDTTGRPTSRLLGQRVFLRTSPLPGIHS